MTPESADRSALTIILESGSEAEVQARERLLRLLADLDLDRWRFTDEVRIASGAVSHSHPVLTLSIRHLNNDERALSTYLHEQLHWWVAAREDQREAALAEARTRWPDVPPFPEGARTAYSTYLHLAVCSLEHRALAKLVGDARARDITRAHPFYTWIYRQVLDQWEWFERWLTRHDLIPTSSGPSRPDTAARL